MELGVLPTQMAVIGPGIAYQGRPLVTDDPTKPPTAPSQVSGTVGGISSLDRDGHQT